MDSELKRGFAIVDETKNDLPPIEGLTEADQEMAELRRKIKEQSLAHQQAIIYAKELSQEIIERRQAEAALRQSELNLKAILDNSAQAFLLIDKNYTVRTVNEVARRRAELLFGRTVNAGDSLLQLLSPTYATNFLQNFEAALAGYSRRIETYQANFWFEYSYNPVLDDQGQVVQICLAAIDITERKRLENQLAGIYELGHELTLLRQKESIIQRVLEMASKVLRFEVAACGMVETHAQQLVYRHRLVNGQAQPLHLALPLGGEHGLGVAVVRRKQAIYVPDIRLDRRIVLRDPPQGSALCVPLKVGDSVIGVLNVESTEAHNFTATDEQLLQVLADQTAVALENARLYEEVQDQFLRLQQSQAQLIQVEKMAALGRLVASIAHEINNPLQSVRSCLTLVEEVLEEIQHNVQISRYLEIAGEEIERIATIVSRMRDFYRPVNHTAPLSPPHSMEDIYYSIQGELKRIDLHAVLESVLSLANKQLQHSRLQVTCTWSDQVPLVEGNPDYLKQVFLNLVLNAIDAMPTTGGALSIETTHDSMQLKPGPPQAVVRVTFRDNGVGMSAETQSRVFEPLFTTKDHGSGFGLYTSYKIVQAHGGQILIDSDENLGTTFDILLPVDQPAPPEIH